MSEVEVPTARRAEALFAAEHQDCLSLLIGPGCNDLAATIHDLGGRVVHASLDPGAAAAQADPVRIEGAGPWPFPDQSFDSVFAPYLNVSTAAGALSHPQAFFNECARVVKPGGSLVVSLIHPWLGAGVRSLGLFERIPVLRRLLGAPRRSPSSVAAPVPFGTRSLNRLLGRAGFETRARFGIWPRPGNWNVLVPDVGVSSRRHVLLRGAEAGGLSRRLAWTGIVPGRLIIAQRTDGTTGGVPPLMERILAPHATRPSASFYFPIHNRRGNLALVLTSRSFFKIALTVDAAERQQAELASTRRLRNTPAAAFMLDAMRHGALGRLYFAEYPRGEPIEASHAVVVAAQAEAYRLLATGAELCDVSQTPAWWRIFSGPSRSALGELGGDDVCEHLEKSAAGKLAMCGMVHGDLNLQNVLRHQGRIVLIDWDRFEADSPLLLDRCNSVYKLIARRVGEDPGEHPHLVALREMSRRAASVRLLAAIDEVAGELDWWEVLTLHVLSTASWRLIHHGPSPAARRDIGQLLAFCRGLAGSGSADEPSKRHT